MKIELNLDLPSDVFDKEYPLDQFCRRLGDLAILELIRVKRLHEHEAQQLLKLERWELVEKMEAAGIRPTEKLFGEIKSELESAIKRGKSH